MLEMRKGFGELIYVRSTLYAHRHGEGGDDKVFFFFSFFLRYTTVRIDMDFLPLNTLPFFPPVADIYMRQWQQPCKCCSSHRIGHGVVYWAEENKRRRACCVNHRRTERETLVGRWYSIRHTLAYCLALLFFCVYYAKHPDDSSQYDERRVAVWPTPS